MPEPDFRPVIDVSTHRILGRSAAGEWQIAEEGRSTPLEAADPRSLLPLLERSWPELPETLTPEEASEFAARVAPTPSPSHSAGRPTTGSSWRSPGLRAIRS